MNALTKEIADFYRTHSAFSNPGCYDYLFDHFSADALPEIKQAIQGLLFHFLDGAYYCSYQMPSSRLAEIELRYMEKILHQIKRLDHHALMMPRKLQNKLFASCREYALLACSILRHHGIPARLRIAFNTYVRPHIFHDQVILEYWHSADSAWRAVDMRMNAAHLKRLGIHINIDYFNLAPEHYISAATAWQAIRQNPDCAQRFGDDHHNVGLWYVRDRLLQELAALNKVEMLIWDCWGMMHVPEQEISTEELSLLDSIAKMLSHPDDYFSEHAVLYANHPQLKVPKQILNVSPVLGKRIVDIAV